MNGLEAEYPTKEALDSDSQNKKRLWSMKENDRVQIMELDEVATLL